MIWNIRTFTITIQFAQCHVKQLLLNEEHLNFKALITYPPGGAPRVGSCTVDDGNVDYWSSMIGVALGVLACVLYAYGNVTRARIRERNHSCCGRG